MKGRIGTILKVIVFLSFGFGILWLLYHNLNVKYVEDCALRGVPEDQCSLIDKVYEDLRSTRPFWLFAVAFCFFVSNISRSLRWQQLLSTMGYKTRWGNAFHCTMLGYFANLGLPRLGEFVRPGTLSRYEKIPFEKVMGTVVVDRALDFLCFGLIFVLALALQYEIFWNYLKENADLDFLSVTQSPLFIGLVILCFLAPFVIWIYRVQLKSTRLFRKLAEMVGGFLDGLKSLVYVQNKPLLLLHTIVIWVMYYLMTYLCFRSFAPTSHLAPLAALLVHVFGSLGMIIPSPGGMGSYHALVIAALGLYGIEQNNAFSFAMIIFFTINLFGNILFGIIALILLPGYNLNYKPARD